MGTGAADTLSVRHEVNSLAAGDSHSGSDDVNGSLAGCHYWANFAAADRVMRLENWGRSRGLMLCLTGALQYSVLGSRLSPISRPRG
jgi:hypothetical protein